MAIKEVFRQTAVTSKLSKTDKLETERIITLNNKDLEKKIISLVHSITYEKGHVCSVDLMLGLGILSKEDYEAWRFGKIEYLEKVCKMNLHKLSLINKTLRKKAKELNLEESWTFYRKFGKGRTIKLRFSKSGEENIEKAYATHYVDKQRIAELKK